MQESYRDPDTGCADAFLDSLFWSVDSSSSSGSSISGSSTAVDTAEHTAAPAAATDATPAAAAATTDAAADSSEEQLEQPLGTRLVYAAMQLLFLGGFTVEPNDYGGPAETEIGEFFNAHLLVFDCTC
jgi:hypothetical protein